MTETRNGEERYTPTHIRLLEVLSNGMPHSKKELHGCLWDELTPMTTLNVHICTLRKILRLKGQDIICELANRTIHYRHVRLLAHE